VEVTAVAPGRVNLIGDYTDIAGGLVLPMAVDLATTVTGRRGGTEIYLTSADQPEPARVVLSVEDPAGAEPRWARYVAGVVAQLRPAFGFTGQITTTLPVGAGLSSSAALEVSVALALGFDGTPLELARLTQRAEQEASGVPCGIMDQLASAAGVDGHALLIDCHTLEVDPVGVPDDVEVRVIHSGQERELASSAYAERIASVRAAEEVVGPLRLISDVGDLGPLASMADGLLTRRARHVVTENARVRRAVEALRAGDLAEMGRAMIDSHRSLREDFEVSTPVLDALVDRLTATPGVYGARLTGAGFGGCVVALAEPGALRDGWAVRASAGARIVA
jgi:galactokinase